MDFNKWNAINKEIGLIKTNDDPWGTKSGKSTGRGGVGVNSYDDRFSNTVTYRGVTYGGKH